MAPTSPPSTLILRIFDVRPKPGARETLLAAFATQSADLVREAPGNRGYFFGPSMGASEETVMFASLWESRAAIEAQFGASWQQAYLPDGYADLIESFGLTHIHVGADWHFPPAPRHAVSE